MITHKNIVFYFKQVLGTNINICMFLSFQARDLLRMSSEIIMKLYSTVIQIDAFDDLLVVSTLTKTFLGNTSKWVQHFHLIAFELSMWQCYFIFFLRFRTNHSYMPSREIYTMYNSILNYFWDFLSIVDVPFLSDKKKTFASDTPILHDLFQRQKVSPTNR